ncbi:MAG: ACT domain-containing protein [Pseudobacteriovorax sp.]|nr:ACT domain-containing protein [Pseudobacteriovorax sp.]
MTDIHQKPKLSLLTLELSIYRLNSDEKIPDWLSQKSFFSVTRTHDELSIVCPPEPKFSPRREEKNWRAIKVQGPLDFSLTGVLKSIADPLDQANISIFAISTFDTDYILVKNQNLEQALSVLKSHDFQFVKDDCS